MKIIRSTVSEDAEYRVVVGRRVYSGSVLGQVLDYTPTRVLILRDTGAPDFGVEELVAAFNGLGAPVSVASLKGGEGLKSLDSLVSILELMAGEGLDRWSMTVAYGGGSLSDVAGFASSIYMRGLPWIVAPTTMLGMVDASVGGKTGVNMGGKNLVGTFHHPSLVLADTRLVDTLPQEEYINGLSEVVKHGVIKGWSMLEYIEDKMDEVKSRSGPVVEELVAESLAVKLGVVSRDPRERRGLREVLNLGHTVAHAIEKASGYTIPHGRAVSIGLSVELKLSTMLTGLDPQEARRVTRILEDLGLPTRPPGGLGDKVLASLWSDKKRRGEAIRLPLVYSIGDVRVVEEPLDEVVRLLRGILYG